MSFEPKGMGLDIFSERYTYTPDETWSQHGHRLGGVMAAPEVDAERSHWASRFAQLLNDGLLSAGGRISANAGRPNQQLLNCFVVQPGDSKEGWGQSIKDMLVISATGGGVGGNFSPVRGRDYRVNGSGGVSTGSVSLMQMWDRVGDILVAGGGRRLALMLCLAVNHPDIEEFVSVKLDKDELNNANISLVIPDDLPTERFVQMVRNDERIPLMFNGLPDQLGRSVSARELWEKVVYNAWKSGEPGVLNQYLAQRESNIAYAHKLVSTNPCGEIWLPAYGVCCLGSTVLPRFVSDGRFEWSTFADAIRDSVRFLDNVLTVNHYPLPETADMAHSERRIGLGYMGLHSVLMDMGLKYTSTQGRLFASKVFKFQRDQAYLASIELAQEKGAFPLFNAERYLQGGFAKRLPRYIKEKIAQYGIRNAALLTIAPTGTTSMVQGVTSGIEPLFAPVFIRRRKRTLEGSSKTETVQTLVFTQDYQDHPEVAEGSHDVSVRAHFEMQALAQHYVDNAVSKTINLPEDYPVEELSEVWLEFLPQLKGSTIYRAGSRGEEPLQKVPTEDALDVLAQFQLDGMEVEWEGVASLDSCKDGTCDL